MHAFLRPWPSRFVRLALVASSHQPDRAQRMATARSDALFQQAQTIPSLDGIRAISVLIVVLGHSGLGALVPGGLGVTIFFFLSGYLISTLMAENQRTGGINILKFYVRRMLRLIPPLFVSLAIAYALTYAGLLSGGITITAQQLSFCISPTTMACFSILVTRFQTAPVSFGHLRSRSTSTSSIRF
jgi:peptidoglycan/LPS O-acetylase OafA/YrhL